ncbi:MAG TPA: sugar phosphate isomerase/epimerase family protein [Gemmataceae bacterium]|jgi:sugar phosphate isomerase/epimerase|nr:sugar phosphate isomerase/epimerase family protein [Gemmataceae bacterium]
MFTLSAFSDEISPDPQEQVAVLRKCGVRHIEFRSILKTNVLALSDHQVGEFQALLSGNDFELSAIGSPLGKIRIDEPFAPHLDKLDRAIELAKRFGTPNIRVFSFYPAGGATETDWTKHRAEVLKRLGAMVERAETASVRLLHENEHRIYGDSPERVSDLLRQIQSPSFAAVYDPANYVFSGYDPISGWQATKDRTVHFHIKDWVEGEEHGRVAGEGQGRIAEVLTDAVQRGYDGFATLEPHLLGGGPAGGVTGPDLFPTAVEALRTIFRQVGAQEAA